MDLRCQNSRAWSCKKPVWQVTCCKLKGVRGHEIWWKMDAQMVPPNHQNRAIRRPWSRFLRFGEFLTGCVLWWVFRSAKSGPEIAKFSNVGGQIDSGRLFGRGRRERRRAGEKKELGVWKLKSIQFRMWHAALKVSADLKATASAADP